MFGLFVSWLQQASFYMLDTDVYKKLKQKPCMQASFWQKLYLTLWPLRVTIISFLLTVSPPNTHWGLEN